MSHVASTASASLVEFVVSAQRPRRMAIERLAILQASSMKLWPCRNSWQRIGLLRLWMMPTAFVSWLSRC